MKITRELAQSIVDRTMKIINKNINIMDENGIIIGSGNKKRLNQFHEGAERVIKQKREVVIYPGDTEHLSGAKPGINLPIEYNGKVIGVVGITGDPGEVSPFGEIIKMTVEMMLQQEFLLKELHLEEQARENFIQDLISGRIGTDEDLFMTRGQIVGYDVRIPRVALVINIHQFEKMARESISLSKSQKEGELRLQRLKNEVLKIIKQLFVDTPQDIVSYTGGDRFLVLKTVDPENKNLKKYLFDTGSMIRDTLSNMRKCHVAIGIGEYYSGIEGIKRSYQDAVKALDVGMKLGEAGSIYHIGELGIYKILADIDDKIQKEIVDKIFLLSDEKKGKLDNILFHTLEVFFEENLSISRTAERLYIHRNTLLYRLKRIKELTGLNPKKFNDAVHLKMAIAMKTYQEIKDK